MSTAVVERRDGEATREKIRRAAESLFTRRGLAAVTLREIAREAGQRNVAAVQYHFGSKEGLIADLVDRHQAEIDAERRARLDRCLRGGREQDLDALLDVLLEPLAAKLESATGRAYLLIQAERLGQEGLRPATRELVGYLSRALGTTRSDPERDRLAVLLVFHALADRARQEEHRRDRRGRARLVQHLRHVLAGLFDG
ncbi:MAG: TetR family transcriptional regulator [Myxococcota bacterium]